METLNIKITDKGLKTLEVVKTQKVAEYTEPQLDKMIEVLEARVLELKRYKEEFK